jgi:hypothetical protein
MYVAGIVILLSGWDEGAYLKYIHYFSTLVNLRAFRIFSKIINVQVMKPGGSGNMSHVYHIMELRLRASSTVLWKLMLLM